MATNTPTAPTAIFFSLADLGLPTSQQEYMQAWLLAMQTNFPGYIDNPANQENVQAQVFGSAYADLAQMCVAGGVELWRTFGTKLLNLPYEQGNPASAIVTVTAGDTVGHTLPQATTLTLTLNGAQVSFQTVAALTIPAGQASGQVTVVSVASGSAFNGAGSPAQLVSQLNWVTGVSVLSVASGGADQEDDEHYIQRLAQTTQTLKPSLVTAGDAAALALNFQPAAGTDQQEVGRATAIDGYDPGTNTYNNQRELTVCISDASGIALNSDTMAAVATYLRGLREANFIINVVAPNYTNVYVACQIHATPGYTSATVQANVQASLLAYLNPSNFGLPQQALSGWNNSLTVPLSRVNAVIQGTLGVAEVLPGTMAVDVNASPTNTANDLVLGGPFPLPITTTTTVPLTSIQVV